MKSPILKISLIQFIIYQKTIHDTNSPEWFWLDIGVICGLPVIDLEPSRQWPKAVLMKHSLKSHYFKYLDGDFLSCGQMFLFVKKEKKITSQILYQLTSLFERTVWICFNKTKPTMRENMMSLSSFYPKSIEKEENIDNLSEILILNFIVHYISNPSMQP